MNIAHDPLERAGDHLDRAQSVLDAAQRVLTTAERVRDSAERTRELVRTGAIVAIGALAIGALVFVVMKQRRRNAI